MKEYTTPDYISGIRKIELDNRVISKMPRRKNKGKIIRGRIVKALVILLVIMLVRQFCVDKFGLKKMNGAAGGFTSSSVTFANSELEELYANNPDARDFVKDYDKYYGSHFDIDISDEVNKGGIPRLYQWDKRWGYENYGSDIMGLNGCGPTSLSMVYCGLTGNSDMNPYQIAKMAEAEGYYVNGQGSSWNMMDGLASELGLYVSGVGANEGVIIDELSMGHPIIAIMGPGDFTTSGHFIVFTGIDDSGKIIVNDPNSKKNSKKKWELERILPQIQSAWSYSY
ncbi:MAG: C39 family peptidase [Lachnospiraceae bacterium]|nr:C39 family peptidase [Lachnospiraceae bacterium]